MEPARRSLLELFEGTSSWDYLGYSVVNAGDTNGDGATDVLALALPNFMPSVASHARLLKGQTDRSTKALLAPMAPLMGRTVQH